MYLERIQVYVSPVFMRLFHDTCSDLHVKVCPVLPQDFMLDLNIVFKAWNKAVTNFNDEFFADLLRELKDYFPTYICMTEKVNMRVMNVANDWYCIDSCKDFEQNLEYLPTKLTLTDFCRKNGSVIRRSRPISLLSGLETLSRLNFLRLSNVCIKDNFFSTLFSECPQLQTLDIYVERRGKLSTFRSYTNSLARSVHVAKSLKNIKLTSEDIDYVELFGILCNFHNLENIHICEYERNVNDIVASDNIVLFIKNCINLYSLFIEADMPSEDITILIAPLREIAQKLDRYYLCIEVCDCYRGWNPFVDVFNPSPLHILD
ncbi:unnamed protein product [Parnassius apollo]|uniref:(apollo) hypothetical protein n=1 Tax=Parnassius apollo TaxID=110799 RepID=A0A8S3XQP0_PARAO|nr:unnamed protein product [Parnassius apollo]